MGWQCPHHRKEDRCRRRDGPCEPAAEGCVLHGRMTKINEKPKKEPPDSG